ncbi:MAG: PAS domain-containing protein, partial [Methanosarcinaceae archaeon]|nr:PAS domain-containing protein [Methanosarcinaceae archaeon]
MKIRNQTIAIFVFTFLCLLVLLSITTNSIIGNSFSQLEQEEVSKNAARANAAVDSEIDKLEVIAADWGEWDDSYYFVRDEGPDYIVNNLGIDSLANLQVDMMLYYDAKGQLYHAAGIDRIDYEEKEVSPVLLEHLSGKERLFSQPGQAEYVSGIINTPLGALLIASNPITRSTDSEEVTGTLIIAKYLDPVLIEELENIIRLPMSIESVGEAGLVPENDDVNIDYVSYDLVIGKTILDDLEGEPAFVLNVEMTRDIYQQGQVAINYMWYAILVIGAVSSLILVLSVETSILTRISLLNRNLKAITKEGNLSSRVILQGNDELYEVAANVNKMLEALENNEIRIKQSQLETRQKLEMIFKNIISGIMVIDARTHEIIDVNPVAGEIIGIQKEDIVGHICHDFICPTEKGACPVTDLGSTMDRSERVLVNKKKEHIPILKSVYPVNISGRDCLIESFVDLSRIKKTEEKLIQARMMAEAANHSKSNFLATMSHELRTPLNSIIGFSDLMLTDGTGELNERHRRFATNISSSGKHLLSLINNVLDISKIEAGKFDLNLEFFYIDKVFSEIQQ